VPYLSAIEVQIHVYLYLTFTFTYQHQTLGCCQLLLDGTSPECSYVCQALVRLFTKCLLAWVLRQAAYFSCVRPMVWLFTSLILLQCFASQFSTQINEHQRTQVKHLNIHLCKMFSFSSFVSLQDVRDAPSLSVFRRELKTVLTMYCALSARPLLSADLSPCTGCYKLILLILYGGPAAAMR